MSRIWGHMGQKYYRLCSKSLQYEKIKYFKVSEWMGHISDHCSLECGLRINTVVHKQNLCKLSPHPPKYKWYEESPVIFKLNAVSSFNNILHKTGDRCLIKTKNKVKQGVRQKWFDRSCDVLRQQVKKRC